jgi:group I intron endonuclease
MGIIYLIKNITDNKCYVGQTTRTLRKRWLEHCKINKCVALSNAIQKYKPENFTIEQIYEGPEDELDEKEKEFIIKYNSICPNGYNIQSGGNKGKTHCEESRERMRLKKLGSNNYNFNKPRTDDTKKKISDAKKGEKHHFFGKKLTLDHKLNLSKSHKKTSTLPMYLVYLKARPNVYQAEGYAILNHPSGNKKYFTSKLLTLEEKFKLASDYLNNLNSL